MHAVEALVHTVNGSAFAGIDTITDVTLTGGKKNPQQGRVTKVMNGAHIQLFSNKNGNNAYENMVNKRLAAEGKPADFQVSPRKWGHRVKDVPMVEHNGELYLEAVFIKAGAVHYLLDGQPVAESDIIGLPVKKEYEDQQGGVDNKVQLRTFKLSSIKALRIAGAKVEL